MGLFDKLLGNKKKEKTEVSQQRKQEMERLN